MDETTYPRRAQLLMVAFLAALAWSVLSPAGAAEQAGATTKPAAAPVPAKTPQEIAQVIEQLDHPEFARREEASKRLEVTGKPCISALETVAAGPKPEPSARAMELLKTFADREDEATKNAAMKALERIASGKSSAAEDAGKFVTARRPQPQPRNPIGIRIAQGGIAVRRMSVKNVNGVKEIEADEDGKTVKILDDPNKGITVEVTQKKDGKDQTDKYEAKTAAELEKKHPEAHKLYKQYSGGGGAIQVMAAGVVPNAEAVATARAKSYQFRMQTVLKQLEALTKEDHFKAMDDNGRKELLKQIESARSELAALDKKVQAETARQAKEKADKETGKAAKKDGEKGEEKPKDGPIKVQGAATGAVIIQGNGAIELKVEIQEAP